MLIALTTVFTLLVRDADPRQGYVNLSDVAITFAGLIFGPWVGMRGRWRGDGLGRPLGGFCASLPR